MRGMRWLGAVAAIAATGLLAVGCGSSGSSSSTGSSSTTAETSTTESNSGESNSGAFSFGKPNEATGSPYVFGMINDENGPVTFPQARQGAIAAAEYVNEYLGGIDGHPIKIENCVGDATPATSARCANQLVAKHPVAILGAADVGEPASIPIYEHADLAYIGGIPFTPVTLKAPNSIQFWPLSDNDGIAAGMYAGKTIGAKSAAMVFLDNPTGRAHLTENVAGFEAGGVSDVEEVPFPPSSPDPSPQAALVQSSGAEAVFVAIPVGCGNMLKSLNDVGYTGAVFGTDLCSAEPEIAAAAGGAENMYYPTPFLLQSGQSEEAQLFQAAMKEWAEPGTVTDSVATAGFATVMNVQAALSKLSGKPTTSAIMKAFKSGSNIPNFLSHPYTCDGKQMTGAPAVCQTYYLINQIQNGEPTQPEPSAWVDTNIE